MINKKKIKKVVVGGLIGCITLQAMLPSNVLAKPRREVPVTSLISVENDEQIAMKGNDLTLSTAKKKKQQWRIEPVDKVFCTIKSEHNNKLMQIEQEADGDWTVSLERKETLEDEQLWYVEICEEDTYRIKSKANDMCLEIEKEDDGKYSFTLGEEAEEETQLWEMNEKSYDYANQYFTYLEEQNPELVSMKEQIEIEKLQDERLQLCENYGENQEEIQEIDNELNSLGAVELTEGEAAEKMGIESEAVSPNARVAVYPNRSGVAWSSSRYCVVYNGKVIELQTLVAKPNAATSALRTSSSLTVKDGGFKAGTRNLLKAISKSVVGYLPEIGGDFSKALTVYNWASAYISGFSSTTLISNIEETYKISQLGETKIVYAKYQGSSDSTQILAYKGNKTNATVTSICDYWSGYSEYISHMTKTVKGSYASPMYASGYKTYAAKLFYNYKNNISDMNEYFTISKFPIELIDGKQYSVNVVLYY